MSTSTSTNIQDSRGVYVGNNYVINSTGGFSIQQGLPRINLRNIGSANKIDVTDALQIKYPVVRINNKSDPINDEVTITAEEILDYITPNRIISMGKLSTLYEDFNYTILKYFGDSSGFSTLFVEEQFYNINQGIFDKTALIQLFNNFDFDINGTQTTNLTGSFKVSYLSDTIRYASETNVFNNRPIEDNTGPSNGFVAGDLIYIPNGISITLTVNIEPEPYAPINIGPTNLSAIDPLINYTIPETNISKQTSSSLTNITQTYSVPILVSLTDENFNMIGEYAVTWSNKSKDNINSKNWLSISVSASGKYQTAIEEYGDIYISNDFGDTWVTHKNIGYSLANNISISLTGKYISASNGLEIYTSSDYGRSWNKSYNSGTCQIFVSMCITGKYQAVISSGDGLYQSSDYGVSWTKNQNISGGLYNSILAFPTAGISLSFDGKRQIIVSEAIYLSTDYGNSWSTTTIINDTNREFDDHNWVGCDMSSDGQYMAAIEVTGEIYTSSDFGNNWIKNDNPIVRDRQWQAISISATGKFQTAVEKNGYIFISVDYGLTWRTAPDHTLGKQVWQSISLSSNGMYQSALVYGGDIYTAKLYQP